ncbi:MAG TPA: late competence development ComFB family protein [Burkholderiaceae bacterium]|nr:late competence development ComFB family protein [Burkholderiaceae bacterium]
MSIEQIHNYYERLVVDEVFNRVRDNPDVTADMVADMACVALNRLPARYVRHDVDLVFYLTEAERHQSEAAMANAISDAIDLVLTRSQQGNG